MRKFIAACVVATAGIVSLSGAAGAEPKHEPEPWTCDNGGTAITIAGRNGWIDGVKYHAIEVTGSGSFTPTGGEPQPFTEHQVWAGGDETPDVTCTTHFEGTDADGTFVADFTVTAERVG